MSDRFPWFPFYVADWRLSRAVRQMTYEQRGMYHELLCVAWGDGTESPYLINDGDWLSKELGISLARWRKIGGPIVACFEAETTGRLVSARLTKAWEIQRAKYDLAKKAGLASADRRRNESINARTNARSTGVASPLERKRNHTDADTDRTKSSSAPTLAGASLNRSLASANRDGTRRHG